MDESIKLKEKKKKPNNSFIKLDKFLINGPPTNQDKDESLNQKAVIEFNKVEKSESISTLDSIDMPQSGDRKNDLGPMIEEKSSVNLNNQISRNEILQERDKEIQKIKKFTEEKLIEEEKEISLEERDDLLNILRGYLESYKKWNTIQSKLNEKIIDQKESDNLIAKNIELFGIVQKNDVLLHELSIKLKAKNELIIEPRLMSFMIIEIETNGMPENILTLKSQRTLAIDRILKKEVEIVVEKFKKILNPFNENYNLSKNNKKKRFAPVIPRLNP